MNEKVPLQLVISAQILASLVSRHGAKVSSIEHLAELSLDAGTILINKYNQLADAYKQKQQADSQSALELDDSRASGAV